MDAAPGSGDGALLIVLPGRSGREPVLRRLCAALAPVRLAVLVPRRLSPYSDWAKHLAHAWIEFGDESGFALHDAWEAVSQWLGCSDERVLGCTTWDEWGIEICAYLCCEERLNLRYTPLDTVRHVRNKVRFREACAKAGVPVPGFAGIQNEAQLESVLEKPWRFPTVLKPAQGAGSYYCRKAESAGELLEVFAVLDDQFRKERSTPEGDIAAGWILEEWFTGQEVDIDGWAKEGQVEWFLISDNKPVLGQGCCETGGLYPSQLPEELQQKLEALTRQVVAACPGLHSAFHFEALVNLETKAVMPVELNLRVGGAECPCCVEAVTGVFLPLCAAELALGRPVTPPSAPKAVVAASSNEYAPCAGTVQACEGSEELFADEHFLGGAFFAREGASYVPGRGSMSCLCWLAAKGGDAEEAERNLQRCISNCRLQVS
ncbi:unnamed protein product [Effrenium voratum]|uniref:ATP-grasp domain-containing protein n=1 Tax=Effrenium voratum TaxID=2562239 RepID=A0AA36J9R8_9DINO|nr:unnamed protein product [Effrenium voratum]CAJ1431603.1 unnamed protein product [Effrenium voratum]